MAMSDHQDSEAFSYERSWEEIENMLDKAERTLNYHQMKMLEFRLKAKSGWNTLAISKPFKVSLKPCVGH